LIDGPAILLIFLLRSGLKFYFGNVRAGDHGYTCSRPVRLSKSVGNNDASYGYGDEKGIVLVCKSWNIIATPLLYECVELQTQAGTEMLLRTLKLRARQGGSPGAQRRELRLMVKRLDLAYGHLTISYTMHEHVRNSLGKSCHCYSVLKF